MAKNPQRELAEPARVDQAAVAEAIRVDYGGLFGKGLNQAEVCLIACAEQEGGLRALERGEPFLQFDMGWKRARD